MIRELLSRTGPLLALALTAIAAGASLLGPGPVEAVAGSVWFIAAAALVAVGSLLSATLSARRAPASVLLHLGLVVGLAGVGLNQLRNDSGYLFLEQGVSTNFYVSRDFKRTEELPTSLRLDSIGLLAARAFRPAHIAWVQATGTNRARGHALTYNRPLAVGTTRLLFSQPVERGFLREYELAIDNSEYLLLHNQHVTGKAGCSISSFAYDPDSMRVGLKINDQPLWLGIGESTDVRGMRLKLQSAAFATNPGVILLVNDIRYRFVIYAGFGLMLLGLIPPLLRREQR